MHAAGGYLFVHAGLRPRIPLARQSRLDMLWIREPFLSFDGDFPAVVVHGHTPESEPVIRHNRIGIDTGACLGGRLTCVVLEADRLGFLQAEPASVTFVFTCVDGSACHHPPVGARASG